jgi:hypothetical protein
MALQQATAVLAIQEDLLLAPRHIQGHRLLGHPAHTRGIHHTRLEAAVRAATIEAQQAAITEAPAIAASAGRLADSLVAPAVLDHSVEDLEVADLSVVDPEVVAEEGSFKQTLS